MAKTSKKVLVNITEMQANEALGSFGKSQSRIDEINAKLEQDIADLRTAQAAELKKHSDNLETQMAIVESYAQAHPELFIEKKSIELQHGTIGYATNPPSVKQFKGVKVETTVDLMRKSAVLKEYVTEKTTYSIDKKKLIEAREDKKVMSRLENVYLEIVQDETFYVKPKKEAA